MAAPDPQTATGQPILTKLPQALRSGFASRLRLDQTTLFISAAPVVRSNKRAAAAVSYAEIDEDYDDDDEYNLNLNLNGNGIAAQYGNNSVVSSGTPSSPNLNASFLFQTSGVAPEKLETKQPVQPAHIARIRHMLQYNDVQLQEIADLDEVLVPIRLSLEHDNFRISDFFLWNLNEKVLTPEMFAVSLCQDLDLPIGTAPMTTGAVPNSLTSHAPSNLAASYASSPIVNQIVSTMNSQIHEYRTYANVKLPEEVGFHVVIHLNVNLNKQLYEDKFEWDLANGTSSSTYPHEGKLSPGTVTKRPATEGVAADGVSIENGESKSGPSSNTAVSSRPSRPSRSSKTGTPVAGATNTRDDVVMENDDNEEVDENEAIRSNGPGFTPLDFAKTVVQDLGLTGEFYPAIAHALYENLYRIKKEALEGHLPPQEIENYAAFGQEAGWRIDQEMLGEEWAPSVEVLSQEEIEKREIERERNIRRLKRESMRMGSSYDTYDNEYGRRKRTRRGESPASWF